MITGAIIIVANIITGWAIQYFKIKSAVIFVVTLFPLAGAAALYVLPRGDEYKHQLLAVFFIIQIMGCLSPCFFTWG
jgi:hypothetical protein